MDSLEQHSSKASSDRLMYLDKARTGFWLFGWIGLVLAALWWVGASIAVFVLIDASVLADFGPVLIVTAFGAVVFPGFMLVMLGLLAREQARSGAANAIVLEAASSLLSPARDMVEQTETLAGQMVAVSREINHVAGQAASAMKTMSDEIGNERARLESVSYASSDNARELVRRLAHERNGFEKLSKDLHDQADVINQAIPRQAALMVDSAKIAAGEVARAEEALQSRLAALDQTARSLYGKIAPMDKVAGEVGQRNESLFRDIVRMDEKLEQIRQTIEATARASELAVTSADTTGNRLTEAITMALDSAEQVSATIQNQTLETAETAAHILADLKEAGRTVTAAIRSVSANANAETGTGSGHHPLLSSGQDRFAGPGLTSPFRDPRERDLTGDSHERVSDEVNEAGYRAGVSRSEQVVHVPSAMPEVDRFDDMPPSAVDQPDNQQGPDIDSGTPDSDPAGLVGAGETNTTADDGAINGVTDNLRDIIADMEREEHHTRPREETAGMVIAQLEDSGIRLNDVFRYRHKKKIATAARKGQTVRRDAINRQARRQVERVRKRLAANPELAVLAHDFVALERSDALNALEDTAHLKRNASARLAGYLLLDTAMSEVDQV